MHTFLHKHVCEYVHIYILYIHIYIYGLRRYVVTKMDGYGSQW